MAGSQVTTPRRSPFKLFFVGDNSSNANWGRGASLALGQLLSDSFEITGRVTGDFFDLSTAEAGYVGTLMPAKYYAYFRSLMERRWRRPTSWYIKIEQWCGAKDFIVHDPAVSIDNLLAHKKRYPALDRIYNQAQQADLIVLDGDGDIIFSTPPRRQTLFLLAMIELGIRLRKPVFLVNSMISDCPETGRNKDTLSAARRLITQCAAVTLRDPQSYEYVSREMPEANSFLVPDSLFSWYPLYAKVGSGLSESLDFLQPHPETESNLTKFESSKPYICVGGGALAGSQPERALRCYSRLVEELGQLGHGICLTENDLPDSFLREVSKEKHVSIVPVDTPILTCGSVLANARLFISGRYHPSIFASLGGTPCIFLATHAHKMGSLSKVLEYETHRQFSAFPDELEINDIVRFAMSYLEQGETLRTRIREVAKLRCGQATQLPELLKRHMYD